jgi:hypothetical protein
MKLIQCAVDNLNNGLDDLGVEGMDRFSLKDLNYSENMGFDGKFANTCSRLLSVLSLYDSSVTVISSSTSAGVSAQAIIDACGNRKPHFSAVSDFVHYRILSFLIANLQAERLRKHSSTSEARKQEASERGKIAFELDKICRYLDMDVENRDDPSMLGVFSSIQTAVNSIPPESISNYSKILPGSLELNENQVQILSQVEEHVHKDFLIRRKMLTKRLDATIQSFLWGEQVRGKESEIVAAIQAQRSRLSEEPIRYNSTDAMNAPISLLREHTKKVTDQGGQSKALVKSIIIGTVPDRGGRANEMRPKSSDIRPNYGGGRGGGGGGGGGHNHHNNNNHNNNHNRGGHGGKGGKQGGAGQNNNSNSNSNNSNNNNNNSNKKGKTEN